MAKSIDLNCDLGEIEGPEGERLDRQMMECVSSINIACGGHAGDADRMRQVVEWAMHRGVAIGAHPGYEDRVNFGRVIVLMNSQAIYDLIIRQVSDLASIAQECGGRLHHVKPHGALYNLASTSRETADAIVRAVRDVVPQCLIVGLSGGQLVQAAQSLGLLAVNEVFADRNYAADGTLLTRQHPQALLHDPLEIALRAASMIESNEVTSIHGTQVPLHCDSICVHSDTPSAIQIATAIRRGLELCGIEIQAVSNGR